MSLAAQPLVKGFSGEDRLHADDVLTDNISPDAQNCDYQRHTIKKRKGFSRMHATSIKEGGQHISNSNTNGCIVIPHITAYDWGRGFTVSMGIRFTSLPAVDCPLIGNLDSGTATGWELRYSPTFRQIYFQFYDTTSTLQDVWAIVSLEAGRKYIINGQITSTGEPRCGVDYTISSKGSGYTLAPSSRDIYIGAAMGAAPGNQTVDIVVDEVRFWTKNFTWSTTKDRLFWELNQTDLTDTDLVGYWRLNESRESVYDDLSINRNHAYAYVAGPSPTTGMVPLQEDYGTSIRFDGADDYASAAYNSNFATILNTGKTWTIEGWLRLDNPNHGAVATVVHLGDGMDGVSAVGYPFRIYIAGTDHSLYYSYSTATTDTDVAVDSGYDVTPGSPVHLALVRDGTEIRLYINGELYDTTTGVADEAGPSTSVASDNGMYFGAEYNDTGYVSGKYAPVTLDEWRLWDVARSGAQIQAWRDRILSDTKHANLKGYWRFDGFDFTNDEVQGGADVALKADGTRPYPSEGVVYPQYPPRLLMTAPLARHLKYDEVKTGKTPWDREIVVCTKNGIFSIQGDEATFLKRLDAVGESALFSWVQLEDRLVFCNGLDVNYKYDGAEKPQSVSIDTPSTSPSAAAGNAGDPDGTYKYRVSFRNSRDGTESLACDEVSVTVSSQEINLTSIPVSTNAQVNQRRIYRTVAGGSTFRYLADIDDNTTTTYTDTTADASMNTNEVLNEYRGHVDPHRFVEVYASRLWFGNSSAYPSGLRYSEASAYTDFPAVNLLLVDRGGGDEITGLKSAYGGLLIFKEHSIHFLTGTGATTFDLRKVVDGFGCVSGHTISSGPGGIYYLSHDGVYLLGSSMDVQLVSRSQRPLFAELVKQRQIYATGVYDHRTSRYILSFEGAD